MSFVLALLAAGITSVPAANPKITGASAPNELPPELVESPVIQGAQRVENPATAPNGTLITHYGYDGNGPLLPAFGSAVEASKTEPDKNTYLVLHGQRGADPSYDYGTHFLFQGHEGGRAGYLTRVNLDADSLHRVTILASSDASGASLPTFDGSTWDPFAQRLLFTAEGGPQGGAYQATLEFPSRTENLFGAIGQGGFEGIQNDSDGNVWIVEDSGGASGAVRGPHAKQPNSFVFRFVPVQPSDLTRGKLQALQVTSLRTGQPIVFHAGQADADIFSDDVQDLHTYGLRFATRWVTVHDTATQGNAPFNANAAAKAAAATPFKRPENGVFRPGTQFREFFFTETGDTDSRTEAGETWGGFGALFELSQRSPSDDQGVLSLFFRGDVAHTGLDNVIFWSRDEVVAVEDAGDTLHTQRNALDSAYLFDAGASYAGGRQPLRLIAEGRDASATLDSGTPGTGNEGDNEITGIHVSDGDPSRGGILGAKIPHLFHEGWRAFWTQQHGDNFTWEILPAQRER